MKLTALRDFMAVAECGGLRAAARFLDVQQPSITRSIQELEQELGVVLFERHAHGVRLTRMGEVFLCRAKSVRSELQRAQDELDQLRGEVHGTLSVCLSTVAHLALLPHVLDDFRARYPLVDLTVIDALYSRIEPSLKDGSVDCYVGPMPDTGPPELVVERLFDNPRVVVARRGHPLAGARTLAELVHCEWVGSPIALRAEDELGPLFERHGLKPPRIAMHAQSSLTFLVTLCSSDLLMLLPVQWLHSPFTREHLQCIDVSEPLPSPTICAVRRSGMPQTPAAEYFLDMVRRAVVHLAAQAEA